MSPIYCYYCEKCKKEFEVLQNIKEEPYTKHSEIKEENINCNGNIKRVIQSCNWILLGGGWTNKFFPNRGRKK